MPEAVEGDFDGLFSIVQEKVRLTEARRMSADTLALARS